MTAPQPVLSAVCDTCKQPWDTHVRSAKQRARQEREALVDWGDHQSPGTVPPVEPVISHLDCIRALQDANRGPMGHVGPMGASGQDCQ